MFLGLEWVCWLKSFGSFVGILTWVVITINALERIDSCSDYNQTPLVLASHAWVGTHVLAVLLLAVYIIARTFC